ncbi:MAG TPA: response regulator transcription factor [Gemmatimonadaceae bacterium]
MIRIAIVDDHAIVRAGLRMVLEADGGFVVVGEADTASGGIALVRQEQPDVLLVDINLPDDSGLRVAEAVRRDHDSVRVLILSVHDDQEIVRESVRIGAHGYLRKDTTPADLRAAIRAVHDGDAYFSPSVARTLAQALREQPEPAPAALGSLTLRERDVLARIARGLPNKEIAADLGISVRTVESHRDSLMRKTGLRNVAALTRFALESGLLDAGEPPTRAP